MIHLSIIRLVGVAESTKQLKSKLDVDFTGIISSIVKPLGFFYLTVAFFNLENPDVTYF